MKKTIFQKIIIIFVVLAVVFVFDYWLFSPRDIAGPELENQIEGEIQVVNNNTTSTTNTLQAKQEKKQETKVYDNLKQEVNLSVPFISQSPFAKWDELHNEACEEAVLIMIKYWLNNKELDNDLADNEILSSVKYQKDNWGGHYDLNVLDVIKLGREYFNINKIYFTSVTHINDIKNELSKGNLVITPMAGRVLQNPYYKHPGPVYHMVVIKGYDKESIITNDPGTKRGKDFKYSYENFLNAIHDWPFKLGEKKDLSKDAKAKEILKGEKLMIVIEPY